ncbi:hypothetical protein [Azospirillum himalayense]|uniref:Uncharacterized protein n=1 Tax=Azospirillum himalayense TaxID=654847 RepID=A0ABW0GEU2_9PROT
MPRDILTLIADLRQARHQVVHLAMRGGATHEAVANVHMALLAAEAVANPPLGLTEARPVIYDVPGKPLVLALVGEDGQLQAIDLKPLDALALAVDLTTSARRRLAGGGL